MKSYGKIFINTKIFSYLIFFVSAFKDGIYYGDI